MIKIFRALESYIAIIILLTFCLPDKLWREKVYGLKMTSLLARPKPHETNKERENIKLKK